MAKFGLLRDRLLQDGVAHPEQFHQPDFPATDWLELVHAPEYVRDYYEGTLDPKAQRRIGLPWSPALVTRTCTAVGGTILTAELALKHGLACNTAGGTHHAFPTYGSGFCIFNDLAIASRVIQQRGLAQKILIVDLDVHQGDGTALTFQDDDSVFTFSMHCEVNFPGKKLAHHLPDLLTALKPDLVLYDAGVDPHLSDRLGKLALTDTGLFRREMQVLSTCVSAGYPVACVIGGGYGDDLNALVYRHSLLHRAASDVYRQYRL
jgi:acetoin utilization deacetylase AcuC-like enzyme